MKKNKENYKIQIEKLESYSMNNELKQFDIIHLYPKEIAFPNGFHDAMFFDTHIYNTKSREKRFFRHKDGLSFYENYDYGIYKAGIYCDGSFSLKFKKLRSFKDLQCLDIR